MSGLLAGIVLRPWGGMVSGPVTMHYAGAISETADGSTTQAWQASSAGIAPALGGTIAWRRRPELELGVTLGVTFDRFHARFSHEAVTQSGRIYRNTNESYRNRTVPFGPQALWTPAADRAVRPVLGGQLQLWIPSTLQEHGEVREGYPTFWPPVFIVPGLTAGAEASLSEHVDLFVHGAGWVTAGGYEVGVSPADYPAEPPELARLGGGVFVGIQWKQEAR